jgi:hypothetical protein
MSNQMIEVPRACADPQQLIRQFTDLREKVNFLSPVAQIDSLPAMHKISYRAVVLDDDPNGPDVYKDSLFCGQGEVAPTKIGLRKLWKAAGGGLVESGRVDDRLDPMYCEWSWVGALREIDGMVQRYGGTKTVDLRPGSAQIKGKSDKQVNGMAKVIERLAESKAMNAGIRDALALPQKMTRAQIKKGFVIPVLVQDLPMEDPEVRRMLAASLIGQATGIYGAPETTIDVTPALREADVPEGVDPETGEEVEAEIVGDDLIPEASEEAGEHCDCRCGCRVEIAEADALKGVNTLGQRACVDCFPGASKFDIAMHASCKGSMGFSSRPDLTFEKVLDAAKKKQGVM